VELVGLYHLALKDASMESDRLQRNVARLLQFFAKDLRREAGGDLERMASRFVRSKAQYIAQCVIEKFLDTRRDAERFYVGAKERESDENFVKQDEDQFEGVEAEVEVDKDHLDDMDEVTPVDEDYFEDLAMLRDFLLHSSAFQIFRTRLTKFVLPKGLHKLNTNSAVKDRSISAGLSGFWRFSISTSRIFNAVLVAAGCLESPIKPGFIRLRWQCVSDQVDHGSSPKD
jgi:hypothetical protein